MDLTLIVRLSHLVLPYTGVTLAAIRRETSPTSVPQRWSPVVSCIRSASSCPAQSVRRFGDQTCFLRVSGPPARVAGAIPVIAATSGTAGNRVRRRHRLMVLLIRVAPGLRIAIAAACASVKLSPLRFSILNLLSAFIWAVGLMVLVGWLDPTVLVQHGLGGWKGALAIGLAVYGLFKVFGRYGRRATARGGRPSTEPQPLAIF